MKIARIALPGQDTLVTNRYGVIIGPDLFPLTSDLYAEHLRWEKVGIPFDQGKILAPVNPSKVIAIGRNYADHIIELDNTFPTDPLIFFKTPSSIIAHRDDVIHPPWTDNLHHEAELAVVVKKTAKNITPDQVSDHILGYTCANDITARDIQRRDEQWWRAKGADTFCPIGPVIETDIDPMNVTISCYVNDELRQSGSTQQMLGTIYDLIAYISTACTLMPGDVILTGTPAGVSKIIPGDVVRVDIEGIGELSNTIIRG